MKRTRRRRPETHVAIPLPPERSRVARALEPVVRGEGPDRVVDALTITRVFNLEDLDAKEDREERARPLTGEAREYAIRLSSIPLLSSLSKAAIAELAASVHLRTLAAGEVLFHEGQPARSFFIVAEGDLEVIRSRARRRGALARLGPNEVLGVFGLFAGRRRAATVRAHLSSVVLEIPGTALARLVSRHASARVAVRTFYQQRLLSVFLASSPIFGELAPDLRAGIVQRFESKDLPAGATLLKAGEVTSGLCLVMNGQVVLRRQRKGESRGEELLRLSRGQYFGVISALTGTPCAVSANAVAACSVVVLSHRQFSAILAEQPALANLPRRLKAEGLLVSREVFTGDAGVPGLAR
ncbi:MAG TPA: cyclic nucleotide-binding domain-containing protein [Myxococcales bacterium]|nr:cyclic nucleotide-binding domain-containing protein [Myxococcales bacterium]